MTALLSASKNDTAKVAFYVADCRSMGIDVLPPDVNASGWDFTSKTGRTKNPAIRFGMGAVKNVGQGPVELILQARAEGGPFRDLNDFAHRVDLRAVGKRSLECLIKVGALDCFRRAPGAAGSARPDHFGQRQPFPRPLQSGQMSFFGSVAGMDEEFVLPLALMVDHREQLEWERELSGPVCLRSPAHPLPALAQEEDHPFLRPVERSQRQRKSDRGRHGAPLPPPPDKDGNPMGFATLEDIQGSIELVLFPRTWDKYGKLIEMDRVLTAEGKVDMQGGDPKILVDKLMVEEVIDLPSDQNGSAACAGLDAPRFSRSGRVYR